MWPIMKLLNWLTVYSAIYIRLLLSGYVATHECRKMVNSNWEDSTVITAEGTTVEVVEDFYRAMHFSAKRGIAIACRLSVRLSVCLWRWWIVIT